MKRGLFEEGGPHNVRRVGDDKVEMSLTFPTDEDGRTARECPNDDCSPGYFKVRVGTGLAGEQPSFFCPYCRHDGAPSDFTTAEQLRYAKEVLFEEVQKGVQKMFGETLGRGRSGRRKTGGGMFSIEMSYKPGTIRRASRPFEDEVRRDIVCSHCTLDHTVFGLATWCPDCGEDVFLQHVAAELAVVHAMLGDVDRREELLGKRIAAKDLENCLEDAVSIFEASLRALARRAMRVRGKTLEEIDAAFKKMGNAFQSIARTRQCLTQLFGVDLGGTVNWDALAATFEKRHPIAHNLGVVDRKYLERAKRTEAEGREVRISPTEIEALLSTVGAAVAEVRHLIIP